jgi:hypothetical protein
MTPRSYRPSPGFRFPGGKAFAFSIFDDTDVATLKSVKPLYDLLAALGMRTTKTVWPLRYEGPSPFTGSQTLEDDDYAEYMRSLAARGFEIAFHGARMESSERAETVRALEFFRDTLGSFPRSYAGHSMNRENLYWGAARFRSGALRRLYDALSGEPADWFQGHVDESPWFWGDVCQRHLSYVRGFTFDAVDLWSVTPHVCYEDPRTPWVRNWFVSADADNIEEFVRILDEPNQDRLERQGGLCLLSTHLGKGFVVEGQVEDRVRQVLTQLARRDGWFAPVSEILDYLRTSGLVDRISIAHQRRLERRWWLNALRRRLRRRSYHQAELPYLSESSSTEDAPNPTTGGDSGEAASPDSAAASAE